MEPRIRYAETTDGVSIAFSTLGKGMPLVQTPVAACGVLQVEWQISPIRAWDQRVTEKRMLIKYDCRATGLSTRGISDCSLDALVRDLSAVVDFLELPSFALMGSFVHGPVAIAYAARYPGRVSHLILWSTYARPSDVWSPQVRSIAQLVESDWVAYTEAICHYFAGWSTAETTRQLAEMMRKSISPQECQALLSSLSRADVAALLPRVKAPTLVLHRRQIPMLSVEAAVYTAAHIPGAELAVLEGASLGYALEDSEPVFRAVDEFLGEGEGAPARPERPAAGAFHTVLFTDMESSTTLTQRLGDAKAQELVRAHNNIVRDALKACGGSEIKHTGDGLMASFSSASRAIECAVAIQRAVAEVSVGAHGRAPLPAPLQVRIGLNAGEPIAEEQDLFGTAVQLAKRVCDHAEPGQILVPEGVRHLVLGKGFLFSDRGVVPLKGFEDPVRLFEVRWQA